MMTVNSGDFKLSDLLSILMLRDCLRTMEKKIVLEVYQNPNADWYRHRYQFRFRLIGDLP